MKGGSVSFPRQEISTSGNIAILPYATLFESHTYSLGQGFNILNETAEYGTELSGDAAFLFGVSGKVSMGFEKNEN